MSITGIVFSRDRAMQLDATLQSFFLHCRDANHTKIWVLYKTTDMHHEKQYQELKQEYAGQVLFKKEQEFRKDLLFLLMLNKKNGFTTNILSWISVLGGIHWSLGKVGYRFWRRAVNRFLVQLSGIFLGQNLKNKYVFFLVDDNIFVKEFCLKDATNILEKKERLLGFSLRLGKNTTYCYPQRRRQLLPAFDNLSNNLYCFNWTKADGDFGYPVEVSSSLYRLSDVLPLLIGFPFNNPNELESQMAYNGRFFYKKRPSLACYQHSTTFCNPLNLVQSIIPNRASENVNYSVNDLAVRFERGERIHIKSYKGFIPQACHQEVELKFTKGKEPAL